MLETKLYTFLKLAECGSTTRCAELLHITQPAVSQHLKALEVEYGLCLFVREGRHLVLTAEGKRFYQLVRRLATMERQLRETVASAQPRLLRFGATLSISEGVMPGLLPALTERFPALPIRLVTANTAALLEQLEDGALDFALIEGNFDRQRYAWRPFMQARFVGLCRTEGLYSRFTRLEQCLAAPLLLRERGSGSRDIFESECLAHNLHPGDFARLYEIDSIPVILQMAAQDKGITFAYQCAARPLLSAGLLQAIPLTDFGLVRSFYFVTLPGSLLEERCGEMFPVLEQLAREMFGGEARQMQLARPGPGGV